MLIYLFLNIVSLLIANPYQDSETNDCRYYYDCKLQTNVYSSFDEIPQYIDGNKSLLQKISEVAIPKQEKNQYRVILSFIIDKEGNVLKIGIRGKEEEEDYTLLEKTIVNSLVDIGKWHPAKCNGKSIAAYYLCPVSLSY